MTVKSGKMSLIKKIAGFIKKTTRTHNAELAQINRLKEKIQYTLIPTAVDSFWASYF